MPTRFALTATMALLLGLALLVAAGSPLAALTGFTAAAASAADPDLQLVACSSGLTLPVHLTNMAPSVWYDGACTGVANAATSGTRMSYNFHVKAGSPTESVTGMFDLIYVRVRAQGLGDPHGWPVVYEGRLWDLLVGPAQLDPGAAHYYFFEFQLHESMGNPYQGATATCDLLFEATAVNGPSSDDNGDGDGGEITALSTGPAGEPLLFLLPVTGAETPQGQ
ncbi:MAG TPA: hypothetical protein PLJ35_18510 [Anaerolineae bacterium]|nr:hypothetical protein [Anaerolineae bacterium]HPL27555.1 hypothetical protein [Anaerolineae bacterium]